MWLLKPSVIAREIIRECAYKMAVARQWVVGNKYDVSLHDLVRFLFLSNRYSQGLSKIDRIKDIDQYYFVYLKGFSDHSGIYFPKTGYLNQLYIVIGENLNPINWHYYETKETPITNKDIVVDLGAAFGTFTISAAQKAKKVYAVEPYPDALDALKRTFKNNKKVEIIPYAVGSKKGKANMTGVDFGQEIHESKRGTKHFGSDAKVFPVRITTIDAQFHNQNRKVTYLKADLEGFEMEMLKGAVKTIKKYKPKIAITTYHKKDDHIYITEFLKKIHPDYKFHLQGIEWRNGNPIMLHAW